MPKEETMDKTIVFPLQATKMETRLSVFSPLAILQCALTAVGIFVKSESAT